MHNSTPWCHRKNAPSHSPALLTWFGQLTPPKIIVAAQSGGPWLWSFCVHGPDPFTAFVEKNDKADIISSLACASWRGPHLSHRSLREREDWSAGTVEAASAECCYFYSTLHAHHRVCCHVWFLMSYLPSKQDIMYHCADRYVLLMTNFH